MELRYEVNKLEDENFEKDLIIQELKAEAVKLKKKKEEAEDKLEKFDDWLKKVFPKMSTVGRADLRNAFAYASPDLEKGTNSRLRKNTGINFFIPTGNNEEEESELKKTITKFAEENTIEVPDKKKAEKGVGYRVVSLHRLFGTFEYQYPDMCIPNLLQVLAQKKLPNQNCQTLEHVCA